MNLVPARCERSREWVSLRLDAQLSSFEAALLERHLRRCPSCRAFAARATMQTQLLRDAALEQPSRPVTIPARAARRRAVPAIASALVAAAAAAALVLVPGANRPDGAAPVASRTPSNLALFVFAAKPDPTSNVEVPRLRVEPATIADGPVHGRYSLPV